MAIFGRRQPHPPTVLRGLPPAQPAVGRCVVVGQKTGQSSADRYFRRSFAPKIVRGGGQPAVGQLVSPRGQPEARAAAERLFHRQFPPLVVRGGGPPALGRTLITGQKTGQQAAQRYYHPQFAPIQKGAGAPPPTARLVFARGGVAPATDRYFRRSFPPIVRRPGPPPSVARQLTVQRVSQPAARRPDGFALSLAPRVISQPATNPPVGRALLFGARAGQHAADRYFRRAFSPTQKTRGAPASVARALAVQKVSQPAARRPDSFALSLAPRVVASPVTAPVGRSLVVSQACRAAADRHARRAFAPVRKTRGAPPAVARSLTVQKVSQPAAVRPKFSTILLRPSVPRVAAPPAGGVLLFGRLAGQRAAERYFRPQLAPVRKTRVATPAAGVHSVLSISDNGDGTGGVATISGSTGSAVTVYSAPFAGSLGALSWTAAATRTGDGTAAVAPGLGAFFWYAATPDTPPQFSNFVYQALTDVAAVNAQVIQLADAAAAAVLAAWLASDSPPGADDEVSRVYDVQISDPDYLDSLTGRHVWVFPAEYGRAAVSRAADNLHPKIAVVVAERYAGAAPVPTAWLDERARFVEQVAFLPIADPRRAQLLAGVTPEDDGAQVVPYDAELLVQQRLFLSFITVQYRLQYP